METNKNTKPLRRQFTQRFWKEFQSKNLSERFTPEFFEEFQYDAEFKNLFESMVRGLSPYQVIEHLCKSKKSLLNLLKKVTENKPRKIIVTTEQLENLKKEIK